MKEIPNNYRLESRPDCVLPLGRMTLEECMGVWSELVTLVDRAANDLQLLSRVIELSLGEE